MEALEYVRMEQSLGLGELQYDLNNGAKLDQKVQEENRSISMNRPELSALYQLQLLITYEPMKIFYVIALTLIAFDASGTDLSNISGLDLSVPVEQSKTPFYVDPQNSQDAERKYVNRINQQITKTAFSSWPTDETGAKLYGSGDLMITLRRDGTIQDIQTLPVNNLLAASLTALVMKSAPYTQFPKGLFQGYEAIAFKLPFDFANKKKDRFKAPFKLKGNNQHMRVDTSVPY